MAIDRSNVIEHIATGGTIDSKWSPERDTAIPAPTSLVADYFRFLGTLGCPSVESEVLMLKDSRDITIDDKNLIARRVAESPIPRAIVTIGTYLMTDVGKRIEAHPSMKANLFGRRVAMVASMTPLHRFSMSDGGFNLGMAQAALENPQLATVSPVVGVVNGVVAPIRILEKDLTTATFESVDTSDSLLHYDRYTVVPAGGTMDFVFNGLDGVEPAAKSYVPGYLREQVRSKVPFDATPPILKDSRNLTPEDMDMVVDLVRSAPTEAVIVTAGLLRMGDLRNKLASALDQGDDHDRHRRVILTGSRYMLNSLDLSDAPYNLGYAHGKLGMVGPGAHIAVAGRIIDAQEDHLPYIYRPEELAQMAD